MKYNKFQINPEPSVNKNANLFPQISWSSSQHYAPFYLEFWKFPKFTHISFLRLGTFSSISFWKYFLALWSDNLLLFLLFVGLILSYCPKFPGCFVLEAFYLAFSLTNISCLSIVSSKHEIFKFGLKFSYVLYSEYYFPSEKSRNPRDIKKMWYTYLQ